MRPTRRQVLHRDAIILVFYLFLALVLTYPLVMTLNTRGPGHGVDDPAQTWSLWWTRYSIFNLGTSPLASDYVFYPTGINLVAYTPTFLNGILSLPFQFTFGLVAAQNLMVLFALVASGYGAFLFTREVMARLPAGWFPIGIESDEKRAMSAAALAGAVYAFGAWHLNYVVAGHFMLVSNEWVVFFALYLMRIDRAPWRNGMLAALFLILTAWTELTFVPFLAILTVLYLFYMALARRAVWKDVLVNLGALGVASLLGVSPLLANLLQDTQRYGYYLGQGLGRFQVFSAEPISFFVPSAQHPILGAWGNSVTTAQTSYAFVGYTVLMLAAIGALVWRRISIVRFCVLLAVLFALLMLGPTLILGGQSTGLPMPFAALRSIPFVNANRYPVRFNVMLMLALVPLIALGAYYVLGRWRRRVALGVVAWLAFEQLVLPIPLTDLTVPSIFDKIRNEPGNFAVLDLPLGWRGSLALQGKTDDKAPFYQTVHAKRILGGITSRTPRFKFQYFLEAPVINSLITLESGRELDDSRVAQDRLLAPEVIRFYGIRYVNVNRALTDSTVLQYAREALALEPVYEDNMRIVYRISGETAPLHQIDVAGETSVLYFDDRWGRAQVAGDGTGERWATSGESEMWLPLTPGDHTLMLRLRGATGGQKVQMRLNGEPVGGVTLAEDWKDYTIKLATAVVQPGLNVLTFSTETQTIGAPDNAAIGDTEVNAPVDIVATGAGFDAGRFGEIYVGGKSIIPSQRGYHLVAIDPRTGNVDRVGLFDTFADPVESARLAEFVSGLPHSEIVAGVAVDEVSRQLQPIAIAALHELGVEADLRYQFRTGHAFIGVKGAKPGQALERVDGRLPANVAAGKNVTGDRIAFGLGGITIDR